MREIKFRVYSKENEMMYEWDDLMAMDSFKDHMDLGAAGDQTYSPLMQYTSLKDWNGKEIYEGDVIRFNWQEDTDIGVVAFVGGCFKVTRMKRHVAVPLFLKYPTHEVIGNIYEHPHLLEGGEPA